MLTSSKKVEGLVREHTRGKSFCFVIISFKPEYERVYKVLSHFIEERLGPDCVRGNEFGSGHGILPKVREMIRQADLIVADISDPRPNVYYEYGYATAGDRHPVLIACEGTKPEVDLAGEAVHYYREPIELDTAFWAKLLKELRERMRSPLPELRAMLEPREPMESYILAAPRVPQADSRHPYHPDERRTFGDNLGITGILTAFGSIFGTHRQPGARHGSRSPRVRSPPRSPRLP